MSAWENIIHTAMIGTEKKALSPADLPQGLQEAGTQVYQHADTDREEKFLQLASLLFNYRQAGVQPLYKEGITLTAAPAETRPYCSDLAMQILHDIVAEESLPLLHWWLTRCDQANQLIQPSAIPVILNRVVNQKRWQPLAARCCGERGSWLSRFNEAWQFSAALNEEQVWETGSLTQRIEVLRSTRAINPALARQWLENCWDQEDANTRTGLLAVLAHHISEADIPFLEKAAAEKSKKVKEEASQLLKKIPGSAIVQQYQEVLQKAITLKKEKALLGLSQKLHLGITLDIDPNDPVFDTGIEKLSSKKEISDDLHIIYQMMQTVPPSFWETQLDVDASKIIELLQENESGKKLLPALVLATRQFNDKSWALHLLKHSKVFYIDLIPLLSGDQQLIYSLKFFEKFPEQIITYATNQDGEWDMQLTEKILLHAAKNPYQYNRGFFGQHIDRLPVQITDILHRCQPEEGYNRQIWSNTSDYIEKLVQLKKQTTQAFNV